MRFTTTKRGAREGNRCPGSYADECLLPVIVAKPDDSQEGLHGGNGSAGSGTGVKCGSDTHSGQAGGSGSGSGKWERERQWY